MQLEEKYQKLSNENKNLKTDLGKSSDDCSAVSVGCDKYNVLHTMLVRNVLHAVLVGTVLSM